MFGNFSWQKKQTEHPLAKERTIYSAMAKKTQVYDDNSIKLLKGADRVRKRPAVIFGSDGLEGCEHSVFEILSNAVVNKLQFLKHRKPSVFHRFL